MALHVSPQTNSSKSDLKSHGMITAHMKKSLNNEINTAQPCDIPRKDLRLHKIHHLE